jgi:hypothetical protein
LHNDLHSSVRKFATPSLHRNEFRNLSLSITRTVVRSFLERRLLFATVGLCGSRAALASKEKKENEKTRNREASEKISEKIQHVMNC